MIPAKIRVFIADHLRRAADILVRLSAHVDAPIEDIDEAPLPQNPITPEAAAMLATPVAKPSPTPVSAPLAGSVAARMAARRAF